MNFFVEFLHLLEIIASQTKLTAVLAKIGLLITKLSSNLYRMTGGGRRRGERPEIFEIHELSFLFVQSKIFENDHLERGLEKIAKWMTFLHVLHSHPKTQCKTLFHHFFPFHCETNGFGTTRHTLLAALMPLCRTLEKTSCTENDMRPLIISCEYFSYFSSQVGTV